MADNEAGVVSFLYGTGENKDLHKEKQAHLDHHPCSGTSPFYGSSLCYRFCTGLVCCSLLGGASHKISLMAVHLTKAGLSVSVNSGLPSVQVPAPG